MAFPSEVKIDSKLDSSVTDIFKLSSKRLEEIK